MRRFEPRTRQEAVQALFLYFLLYSVIGWIYEVFLEVVVYRWGYCWVPTAPCTAWVPWLFCCALAGC